MYKEQEMSRIIRLMAPRWFNSHNVLNILLLQLYRNKHLNELMNNNGTSEHILFQLIIIRSAHFI